MDNWNAELYFEEKTFFEKAIEALAPPLDAPQETQDAFHNALEDMLDSICHKRD